MRSADSRSGIQHPNYDYEIKGRDELTLTNLAGGAKLIFPEGGTLGTYLVFHRARGSLVAELEKVLDEEEQLHLPPGDYVIKKRIKCESPFDSIDRSLDNYIVEDSSMKTLPLTDDLSKGYETPIFEPTWKHGAPFTKFTAHTLRQGEWVAGLQSVQYGISDDVTIYTLPLTALFGLPLFGVELNLLKSSQWIWSIGFSTIQSLPKSSSPRGWHETRLETTLTYQPIPDIQLSVLSGWALESGPDEALDTKPWEFQKFIVGGSVTWTPLDWFFLQVSTKDSTFFYGTERLEVGLLQVSHPRLSVGGLAHLGRHHQRRRTHL